MWRGIARRHVACKRGSRPGAEVSRTKIGPSNNLNLSYLDEPEYNHRLAEASRLTGDERFEAYAELDEDLARDASPLAAYMNPTERTFFSRRIGCQIFHPDYRMDLATLCVTDD